MGALSLAVQPLWVPQEVPSNQKKPQTQAGALVNHRTQRKERYSRPAINNKPTRTTSSRSRVSCRGRHRLFCYHFLALCSALGTPHRLSAGRRTAFVAAAAAAATTVSSARSPPWETKAGGGSRSVPRTTAGRAVRGDDEDADFQLSAAQMVERLGEVEVHVMVDVVLVGFHGKGARDDSSSAGDASFVTLDKSILQQHLGEIVRGLSPDGKGGVPLTVVNQGLDNEIVQLGIRQKTFFEVSHAQSSLSRQVKNAVDSALQTATSTEGAEGQQDTALVGIPRTAVDDAIRLHHQGQGVSYSLYLLHPGAKHRYEYVHEDRSEENRGANSAEHLQKHTVFSEGCGYVGWVGQHHRYAWLDLGAHVASGWGPRTRALGVVSSSTLPNLPAAAAAAEEKGRSHAWLYPELAALAHRSASQLIVPPLLFTPAGLSANSDDSRPSSPRPPPARWADYYQENSANPARQPAWKREEVVVRLFMVCDTDPCPSDEVHAWAGLDGLLQEPESGGGRRTSRGGGVNYDSLMPRVKVEREEVVLWNSPLLATGLQQAVQSVRGASPAAPAVVSLAAAELRHWLRLFLERKGDSGGGGEGGGGGREGGNVRVVPLFVISLDTDSPVLLDHAEQSTAFPDMVVSVKGREGTGTVVDSGFHCGGRNVLLRGDAVVSGVGGGSDRGESDSESDSKEENVEDNSRRIESILSGRCGLLRDTVSSLAQLIWGVPPRTLAWDPLTGTLGTDYLWATGASVHSPLSPHSSLAFPERDAYFRTHILRRVEAAVTAARYVLEQTAAVEPRLSLALYAGDHARAVDRWRGVRYNLEKCLVELAVHHHESALGFALALEEEVGGLGAVLSRGYGSGVYRTACSCREGGVGDGLDYRERGESLGVLLWRACSILTLAVVACLGVAAACGIAPRDVMISCLFSEGGRRRRKHKYS